MRLLLDTHAFLWAARDPARLSGRARDAITDSNNERVLSAAVAWEIAIKIRLGRILAPSGLESFINDQIAALQLTHLPISSAHAVATADLPSLHKDPFDRILVSQAIVEGLTIVTADRAVAAYSVMTLW